MTFLEAVAFQFHATKLQQPPEAELIYVANV